MILTSLSEVKRNNCQSPDKSAPCLNGSTESDRKW